jgi:hypothetical protein
MLPVDQYCEWDLDRKYRHNNVEIYVVFNQVREFGKAESPNRARKVRVRQQTTLNTILKHKEYVVPGIPVFYLLPTLGDYRDTFLRIPIDSLKTGY